MGLGDEDAMISLVSHAQAPALNQREGGFTLTGRVMCEGKRIIVTSSGNYHTMTIYSQPNGECLVEKADSVKKLHGFELCPENHAICSISLRR